MHTQCYISHSLFLSLSLSLSLFPINVTQSFAVETPILPINIYIPYHISSKMLILACLANVSNHVILSPRIFGCCTVDAH